MQKLNGCRVQWVQKAAQDVTVEVKVFDDKISKLARLINTYMHMFKKMALTALVAVFPLIATAQTAQLKVGIMNPEAVMDALPQTAEVQSELEQFIETKRQEFSSEYSTWMEAITSYEERVESGELSGAAQEQEEQRLIEKEEELGNLERNIQAQIQNRQNELLSPVMQQIENAMQAVAEELDLDYVLNRQTSMGDPVVYYASDRGVDITDRVIERITTN